MGTFGSYGSSKRCRVSAYRGWRMRKRLGLRGVVAAVGLSVFVAACGQVEQAATTSAPALEPTAIPVPEMPSESADLSAPDGSGPIAAIVSGSYGEFTPAPLVAVDASGRTLAYGGGLLGVVDVSVCPGSRKFVVLGYLSDGSSVSVWDMVDFEMEDSWPTDDSVGSVRCVTADGRRVLLYRGPTGVDPSPPTSAGPTTTVLPLGSDEAAGSNSWSILEMDHGTVTTLYEPGEYGKVLAFTSHWAIASHNATLWIVDLSERPPIATILDTTLPARAAVDPNESLVIVAGQWPNSGDPVRLSLYALEPTPLLVDETLVAGYAWATPLEWLDEDRFIEGFTVYDRDLIQVDSWSFQPETILDLVVAGPFAFGTKMGEHWQDSLLRLDTATGETSVIHTFTGWISRTAIVEAGPTVTEDAHTRIPQLTESTSPPRGTSVTQPPVQLPPIDSLDHTVLEDLRTLALGGNGDGDRIRADAIAYASGKLIDVPTEDIDSCSGVGFSAGASTSQPLAVSTIDGTPVIVYAFTAGDDVTVAAVDPATCDILDTVGPLLTPGPGTNITTTIPGP